jgi:hypothetical protein
VSGQLLAQAAAIPGKSPLANLKQEAGLGQRFQSSRRDPCVGCRMGGGVLMQCLAAGRAPTVLRLYT